MCFVAHDILHTGTEHFVLQRFVKESLYQQVTVSGIKDIAVGHVQFFSLIVPAFYGYIDYGTYRAVSKNAFGAESYRFYVGGLRSVPTFQGADTATVANHQYIVSETACKLFVIGIKTAFLDFQSFFELAVWVNGLLLIEINAVSH